MATLDDVESAQGRVASVGTVDLLIGVAGSVNEEELRTRASQTLRSLSAGPAPLRVGIAWPSAAGESTAPPVEGADGLQFLHYALPNAAAPSLPWLAPPTAYREIARLAGRCSARACLMIGQDLGALDSHAIETLAAPLLEGHALLSVPLYPTGKYEGLLNSGILYPFTRALYGKQIRYPLALDFGVAGNVVSRMAVDVRRNPGLSGQWPVVEGILTESAVTQAYVGVRHLPQSDGVDLRTVLATLAGTLFEDAEQQAALWQRVRGSQPAPVAGVPSPTIADGHEVDIRPLVESFNLGLRNLQEIWGPVLPPVTLLELKRMARLPPEQFRMPDSLWANIVYDFALAYRLRTISRTHLLGALTPLYLGWVASYAGEIRSADAVAAEERIERLALAFETAKPYFVARWRWPDRFNP